MRSAVPGVELVNERRQDNARRHGRVRCEMLESNLGTVVDLSASGMKVLYRGNRRGLRRINRKIALRSGDGVTKLRGRIVWTAPVDAKHTLVGVRFEDVTPELSARLKEIVAFAGVRLALRPLTTPQRAA